MAAVNASRLRIDAVNLEVGGSGGLDVGRSTQYGPMTNAHALGRLDFFQ